MFNKKAGHSAGADSGSIFDAPSTPPKASKTKPAKSSGGSMFGRRAKVQSRRVQTPTQAAAIKAARLRKTVFAAAAVVIGVAGIVIVTSKPAPTQYPYYSLKQYLPAGSKVTSSEVQAHLSTSPVAGAATPQQIVSGVLLGNEYVGTIITNGLISKPAQVPHGDVLVGFSLGGNHVPNSQLEPGEKIGIYSTSSNPITVGSGHQAVTYNIGQKLGTGMVVFAPAGGGSSSAVNIDVAIPASEAGTIEAFAATGSLSVGVI
jgi:hypothetical protein